MSTKKNKKQKTTSKKITFFGVVSKALKDAIKGYKAQINKEIEKHKLLSSKSDWSMIEKFIQQINDNPSLKVKVTLSDGTRLDLFCYEEHKLKDFELLDVGE